MQAWKKKKKRSIKFGRKKGKLLNLKWVHHSNSFIPKA